MLPATYNLTVRQGSTFKRTLTLKDSSNALIDLTGATAKLQVRVSPGSSVLLTLSTDDASITLGGTAGTITWDQIVSISPVNALYDLIVTFTNGEVWCIIRGSFVVLPAITT